MIKTKNIYKNLRDAEASSDLFYFFYLSSTFLLGSCHKRQKAQAPTPQAPIRNRQTRKVANAKLHNSYTNLT